MTRPGLLVTLAILLCGCANTSRQRVTVTVRDGTSHAPVTDARVEVRPVHLFLPRYPHGVIGSSIDAASATTDAAGSVTLDAPARHPFELLVLVPFEAPRGVTIDPLEDDAPPWIELIPDDDEQADARTLEVRLE